jgi:hypothetical protein
MALGAASGGVGFIMGPLIAAAFSTLTSCDSRTSEHQILVNFETMPSYFASLLCLINIVTMALFFRESRINEVPSSPTTATRSRRSSFNSRGVSNAHDKASVIFFLCVFGVFCGLSCFWLCP